MDCRDWDRLVAVLALMVPAVGCAEGSIDEAQFTEDLCDSKGLHALMAVEPDEPVDANTQADHHAIGRKLLIKLLRFT